jgi:threonine/homoserine/homoserine lactone efflux protein
VIWMFLPRVFRRFGLLWLAWTAYRYWRRRSPQQKARMKERVRELTIRMRGAPVP